MGSPKKENSQIFCTFTNQEP